MKTLDEIINNENYKKINGALVDRSIELAEKIRNAMLSAELTEIGDYTIRTVRSNSGFSDTALYIEVEIDNEYDIVTDYRNLETTESRYFVHDFKCWIEAAKGSDRLKFLNDARSIIDEIDTIKQRRVDQAEKALKSVEDL